MKSIYITGYMGAGKTTIGKALSKELQIDVVDTDQKLKKQEGNSKYFCRRRRNGFSGI